MLVAHVGPHLSLQHSPRTIAAFNGRCGRGWPVPERDAIFLSLKPNDFKRLVV